MMLKPAALRRPDRKAPYVAALAGAACIAVAAAPIAALDETAMFPITCTAAADIASHPQYGGLCSALSAALQPVATRPLSFRFTAISATHVALDLTGPTGTPLPLQFVIVDRELAPDLHHRFAEAIVRSLRGQGLLTHE